MCSVAPIEAVVVRNEPQIFTYFPTLIYTINKPEFLNAARAVCDEYIEKAKTDHDLNEIYPVYMTGSFYDDPRMKEMSDFIGQTACDERSKRLLLRDVVPTALQTLVDGATCPRFWLADCWVLFYADAGRLLSRCVSRPARWQNDVVAAGS